MGSQDSTTESHSASTIRNGRKEVGNGSSMSLPKDRHGGYKVSRKVWQGRALFVLTLCAVALILGVLALYLWRNEEHKMAKRQFESIVERALLSAQAFFLRRRQRLPC